MTRTPYPTDLTDEQWNELSRPIPPAKPGGRRAAWPCARCSTGSCTSCTGCAWRRLPPRPAVLQDVLVLRRPLQPRDGTWRSVAEALHPMARVRAGREPSPSEAIVDARSVKTTTRKGGRPARAAPRASATTRASARQGPQASRRGRLARAADGARRDRGARPGRRACRGRDPARAPAGGDGPRGCGRPRGTTTTAGRPACGPSG
jgi:hypothetical protein